MKEDSPREVEKLLTGVWMKLAQKQRLPLPFHLHNWICLCVFKSAWVGVSVPVKMKIIIIDWGILGSAWISLFVSFYLLGPAWCLCTQWVCTDSYLLKSHVLTWDMKGLDEFAFSGLILCQFSPMWQYWLFISCINFNKDLSVCASAVLVKYFKYPSSQVY